MANQTLAPGTVADDNSYGDEAWTDPGNATASDDSRASVVLDAGERSHYIKATNFGFSIPAGATIDFINLKFEGYRSGDAVFDVVKLVQAGTVVGSNAAAGQFFNTGEGGEFITEVGFLSSGFTAEDINDSGFGMVMAQFSEFGPDIGVFVDQITISVDYTAASTGQQKNRTLMGVG